MNFISKLFSRSNEVEKENRINERKLGLSTVSKNNMYNKQEYNLSQLGVLPKEEERDIVEDKVEEEKKKKLPPFIYYTYVNFELSLYLVTTINNIIDKNRISKSRFFYEAIKWGIENNIKYSKRNTVYAKKKLKSNTRMQAYVPYALMTELKKIMNTSGLLYRTYLVEKYIQENFIKINGCYFYKKDCTPKKIYVVDKYGTRHSV